jgi:hypothetical protein
MLMCSEANLMRRGCNLTSIMGKLCELFMLLGGFWSIKVSIKGKLPFACKVYGPILGTSNSPYNFGFWSMRS